MNANKRPAVGLFPATSKTRDTGRCGFSTGIFRGNFVYGRGWDKPYSWKERLFGMEPYANCFGWVDDKVAAIGKNKFIVCYENMIKEGYVSEKIFLEPT